MVKYPDPGSMWVRPAEGTRLEATRVVLDVDRVKRRVLYQRKSPTTGTYLEPSWAPLSSWGTWTKDAAMEEPDNLASLVYEAYFIRQ